MNWADERYVRSFVRDTPEWLALSYEAQSLFLHLLRKVDRAGILPLGRLGRRAVAVALHRVELWPTVLDQALAELEADGCLRIRGEYLEIPNFIEAQEVPMSARLRNQEWRERQKRKTLLKKKSAPGDGRSRERDNLDSFRPSNPSVEEEMSPSAPIPLSGQTQDHLPCDSEPSSSDGTSNKIIPAGSLAPEAHLVLALWNEAASRTSLPRSRGRGKVVQTIRTRLRTPTWLNDFKDALVFLEGSKFHQGENQRGWKATLAWVLQNGRAEELAEKVTADPAVPEEEFGPPDEHGIRHPQARGVA